MSGWKGIEVNGPSNILMLIEAFELEHGQVGDAELILLLSSLRRQAQLTIRYLESLQVSDGKPWHVVRAEVEGQ